MRRWKGAAAAVLLGGCTMSAVKTEAPAQAVGAQQPADVEGRRKALQALIDEDWEYTLRTQPEFASILGDKRFNDKLSDISERAIFADLEHTRQALSRFEAVDTRGFPEQEVLNQKLMVRRLRRQVDGARFEDWLMPVTQFYGMHINAPQLVTMLSFQTEKDYDDYLARLEGMPKMFDDLTQLMQKGMAKKVIPPQILLEKVSKQAEAIGASKPEESPFAAPLARLPESFPAARKQQIRAAMLKVIETQINPMYQKFAKFVRVEYAPAGRKDPGVWSLPQGQDYYAFLVKDNTTTDLTPDQIHQLGLSEVARIEAEMLKVANKQGYADLKSFNAAIEKNQALRPRSKQEIIALYQKYTDQMYLQLPKLFNRMPKAKVEVHPVEEFREKEAAAAEYNQGTPDGARPGHINVNTGDYQNRKTISIETTAYHEGVPGHHMQIAIAQELPTLPAFRQQYFVTAYVEGWALYSERLGEEVGFYQDPYSYYGHLQDEMLRAIRLVVDTGFHSKKWTRDQVVAFFHDHSNQDETDVQSETDRYIAIPGQALGYKIGQLKILELRAKAQKELGASFDLRGFHDTILGAGALPLDVLGQQVDGWIAAQKGNKVARAQ